MSPTQIWKVLWILTGGLAGYIIASGVGVAFAGAQPLPRVGELWWVPISLVLFLLVLRLVYRSEWHSEGKDAKPNDDKEH